MEHRVIRVIDRPSRDLVDGLADAGVSTVHEAMGRVGLLGTDLRPIQTGVRLAGPAVTVLAQAGDNLMVHAAIEVCEPGDIIVIATMSPSTDGVFGELIATSLMSRGVVAAVIEAGVRDTEELRALPFPVWAKAVSAHGTVKATPGSVNVPVVCGGQLVEPGSVIIADDDGIVCVPARVASTTLDAARDRIRREDATRKELQAGVLGLDLYRLRDRLTQLGVMYDELPVASDAAPRRDT